MRALLLLSAALLLAQAPAAAQAPLRSPHGELRHAVDCAACHSPEAWRPLRADPPFDHARDAGFALTGAHRLVGCESCHAGLRFDRPRAAEDECAACHEDPHRGRLSTDCASCHDTQRFARARTSAVHERTTFPLTGAHRVIPCESCHRDERAGAFTPVDARCVACHQQALQQALFPDHTAPAFRSQCDGCHRTTSWHGARFDHEAASGFALIGAHVRAECTGCHLPPDFRLRWAAASPQDCVACHRADYDREHTGMGFSLVCTDCHTVDSWSGATFDHDFPIFSGRHAGEWDRCTDCHTDPNNFAVFTCLTCHTQAETASNHRDVANYVYESARCLSCHPRGEED